MNKILGLSPRWIVIPFLVAALLMAVAGRAQAVDDGHGAVISAGEVVNDDALLNGVDVRMDGTVNGTLIASGQNVVIDGTVNGDVVVWANAVTINGVVNGNVYGGGNSLTLNGPLKGTGFLVGYAFNLGREANIDRNLFYAGFSLAADKGSRVGTDLLLAAYQGSLAGQVGRDVLASVAALELHGEVGRNVKAEVGTPQNQTANVPSFYMGPPGMPSVAALAPGLRVAPGAIIGGKLTYTSPVNQDAAIKATPAGGQEFVYKAPSNTSQAAVRTTDFWTSALNTLVTAGRDFLTLMALGALALAFVPKVAARVVQQAHQRALPAAGWGFVVVLVTYALMAVAALLLLVAGILLGVVTFGGLASVVFGVGFSALGLAFTAFGLLVSYGSKLVVAVLVGQLVVRALAPRFAANRYWGLAAGVFIYVVLRDLPGVVPAAGPLFGWLLGVAVTLVGLGAIWLAFREWWVASRASRVLAPAPLTPPAAPAG